ncbi:hypothetical protein Tco_0154094 [Tanacetum coccineum]
MSFSKRPSHDAVCYTKPLDSLRGWNDHFFWVDAFTCPASFLWHTRKSVSKDPFPKSIEFNAEHYASLVVYPALFHKYLEPFLCLVGMSRYYTLDENTYPEFLYENGEEMDLLSFVRNVDPTKVRIGEQQRGEDEPKLLDTTIRHVVPLLPVAPARGENKLEDSVDRLFDEEGNDGQAEQGDSASGGQGVGIQPVSEAVETNIEDVVHRRQEKRKSMIVDFDEPSYPAKKLRKDHGIPVRTFIAGKSMPAIQRLLFGAVQNVTVRGKPVPSLPFVTSSVCITPEREDERHTDTLARTEADSLIRSSASAMTTATTVTVTAGATTVVKETVAKPSLFATGSSSVEAEAVEAIRLRAEASKFKATEKSLQDEIRSLKESNATHEKKKGELDVRVVDLAASVKVRERENAALDIAVATVKLQNDRLVDQVHELETSSAGLREKVAVYENCMSQLEKFQDERRKEVNDKFDKLDVDVIEMALHLEERFYPHLLTTIVGRRWLLTHGIKLAIAKCLHSPKYLSALGAAISRAIEKGMQDGLAAGISHGQEGRVFSDVATFNPFAESDYISALQELQDVNFFLLAELKSNKDANIEILMNILRLEEPIAENLTIVGATSLSFSLDVSHNRVQKIRDNIANHRSALRDVFFSIVEPLCSVTLEGTKGTSSTVPETTTALSVTFAPVSSIPPISMDDYEIAHADDQGNVGAYSKFAGAASRHGLLTCMRPF